ncbi:hypothetical protein SAMN05421786_11512 [Chryseobacterium ureilyticum]|uniref:Uncharacterized protein n=1 Tax=Chryseobacterium ureilyticum TaxID=373668 RepID=A0A1N7QRT9_9FLAO|nr:hypothetical protein SAMN05421786_11512 [Chryseobacterium ureilyticum]
MELIAGISTVCFVTGVIIGSVIMAVFTTNEINQKK